MADEIRNGDSKARVVRLFGHRDNAGAINGKLLASWPLERAPYYLETAVPGSFAAGDVRHRSIKRVATAAGEGAMAIAFVHRYLEETA